VIHRVLTATTTALVGALATMTPAAAQLAPDAEGEAADRFEKGVRLYESGDLRAALNEFKRAYKSAPNYQLLYNMAQAAAELHEYVEAYEYYQRYLRDSRGRLDSKRRQEVIRELEEVEGYLATLRIDVSVDGAEVTVDGVMIGVSPIAGAVVVGAGRRKVTVIHEGYSPWERYVDLAGRVSERMDVKLISLTGPGVDGGQDGGIDGVFWASAGATALLAAGTGFAAYRTLAARDDYEAQLATVPNTVSNVDAARDQVRRLALVTDVGVGLTAIGLVTTVLLAKREPPSRPERRAFGVKVGATHFAVMAEWSY
jgi:tetratricopeptide (TPR) repeat protein